MDLTKAIRQLLTERERLDRVIASLEQLQETGLPVPSAAEGKRRGRKAMAEDERRDVSERMKRYWAGKRKGGQGREPAA
jgi:DNA invertase Pin-like site-specific DNA recombinase